MFRLHKLLNTIPIKPQNCNVLGRWALETCDKKTNSKIDWSNTDHCGTCSFDQLEKLPTDLHSESKEKSPNKKGEHSP